MDPFERDRQNALLRWAVILLFAAVLFAICSRAPIAAAQNADEIAFEWGAPREEYARKILEHIKRHFVTCNPSKTQGRLCVRAVDIVTPLLDAAVRENVNPVIIAAMITAESNWNPNAMEKSTGAWGLMQVGDCWTGTKIIESYSLDPGDQITAGIRVLKMCYSRCGNVRGALACYATGVSCKPIKTSDYRLNLARRINAY